LECLRDGGANGRIVGHGSFGLVLLPAALRLSPGRASIVVGVVGVEIHEERHVALP
jgi:hypothetical protein